MHILLNDTIIHAIGFENFCGFESFPWTMYMSKLPAHGKCNMDILLGFCHPHINFLDTDHAIYFCFQSLYNGYYIKI